VHESGVEAQRDVVEEDSTVHSGGVDPTFRAVESRERGERVVWVEAEIPREVVPRTERDADEGNVLLERDGRNCPQRTVSARDPERRDAALRSLPSDARSVLAGTQLRSLDA
jgi:hypothetical protein